jgi:hypothetical protein
VRDELQQIDVSPIADLVRIKREEDTLRERLEKMEGARGKVSAVVYARVRSDYESKQAALQAEARPLQEQARLEYVKLKAVRGQIERLVEEATLAKEELEFRRDLGEFADGEFQKRLSECEKTLSERRSELDEIEMLRAQFVGAFHSERELDSPPGPPDAAGEQPSGKARSTHVAPLSPATVPLSTAQAVDDATAVLSGRPAGSPAADPSAGAPASAKTGATLAVPMPRLVVVTDNKPGDEYVLKPGVTTIGRSPRSQIRLPQGEVSRHHADVIMGSEGYRVLDAGSDNGIFVNGQRVIEHVLSDGDILQIGTQRLLFKL